MRKIDKTCTLSTEYKTWEEAFENARSDHDPYNSSQNKYYWDVVMNLFYCQKGLCAYTEIRLCSEHYINTANWNGTTGTYTKPTPPAIIQVCGQLEHFDTTLKKRKGWLWNNFFMADTDVNTKIKNKKEVDNILKPDDPSYNEFKLLSYDFTHHIFIPNRGLDRKKKERVKKMINTLGINFDPVIHQRRTIIEPQLKMIDFEIETWDTIVIDQFPTAFEMIRRTTNP